MELAAATGHQVLDSTDLLGNLGSTSQSIHQGKSGGQFNHSCPASSDQESLWMELDPMLPCCMLLGAQWFHGLEATNSQATAI